MKPIQPRELKSAARRAARALVSGLVGLAVAAAPAEQMTILLDEGQTITADVLREYPNRIIVDLGYMVMTIPRENIRDMRPASESETPSETRTDHLYSVADLPVRSVKELTARFGEGVVLVSTPGGLGSGFFISEEGHIVTNFHVIEDETRIAVTLFINEDGEFKRRKFEDVEIVATNPFLDLALIRPKLPEGFIPRVVYLADQDTLRDGDLVFAIGAPLGLERSVSQGIVSRRNRVEEGLVYIQTTTQINPGNSGGPLFDSRGQVVGVTNMKILGGEGLGFAIPTRYVIDFLKNRDAFAYNIESAKAGYRYLPAPTRKNLEPPAFLKPAAE